MCKFGLVIVVGRHRYIGSVVKRTMSINCCDSRSKADRLLVLSYFLSIRQARFRSTLFPFLHHRIESAAFLSDVPFCWECVVVGWVVDVFGDNLCRKKSCRGPELVEAMSVRKFRRCSNFFLGRAASSCPLALSAAKADWLILAESI